MGARSARGGRNRRAGWFRRRLGVRARSTIAAVLIVGLALVVAGVAVVLALRTTLIGNVDATLTQRAGDVAAQIAAENVADVLPTVDATTGEGSLLQVVSGSGRVLLASPAIQGLPQLTADQPGPGVVVHKDVILPLAGPARYRVVAHGVDSDVGPVVVITAQSLTEVARVYWTVAALLGLAAPILLLAVAAATWFSVGRSLRAVDHIRVRVAQIGDSDLGQRVPVPEAEDEVARLARTMNRMLARLAESAALRRRFIADAGHELRSPVTSLKASLEVARAGGTLADWEQADPVFGDEVERMERLVSDLLLLAKEDELAPLPHPVEVDLDDLVASECARLRTQTELRVRAETVPVKVLGDPDALARAIRNLADNASRYAATEVRIRITSGAGGWVTVEVADDGPGIPPDQRERVLERFVRLDADRSRGSGGSGLGLAIVSQVARSHSGTVVVGQSDLGGASVALVLPGQQ